MNKLFSHIYLLLAAIFLMACQSEEANATTPPEGNNTDTGSKTLIVYYSYTNKTEEIVNDLKTLITADVIEVEPTEKGLDYAANNYRIGTEQLNKIKNNPNSESSYPAIEPVEVDMSKYNTVIVATPLWWSQMASNMQTFLFKYGKEMANKNIGLIVSSYSSSIGGVEADAKRLIPEGRFLSKSLWINNANHSRRKSFLTDWLKEVDYTNLTTTNTTSTMNLKVNSHNLTVELVNNSSTEALIALLKEAPITYEAQDYGNFEKVGDIGHTLPQNNEQITTEPGDIILYQGNNVCIYYGVNSWNFTRLGKIKNVGATELKNILGSGDVTVTLSLGNTTSVNTPKMASSNPQRIFTIDGRQLEQAPAKGIYIENGVKKIKL